MYNCENENILVEVQNLCDKLNEISKNHTEINHKALFELDCYRVFTYTEINGFIRIEYSHLGDKSVWGFVDSYGDIYKAKSWSIASVCSCGNINTRTEYSHYSCID